MPEGHTLHRLAREHRHLFGGHVVRASSPQGRFAEGAARIDGQQLRRTEAYGKHLLHHYADGTMLHVHLGLYGKFTTGPGEPPEPRGALRLRLVGNGHWSDLRGATACELFDRAQRAALLARLGPDPLRKDADGEVAYARIARSQTSVAALLMDQAVVAGIGNVYRAELLYRHGVDPFRPGRTVDVELWQAMWTDLRTLMRDGLRIGRIITTRPEDRPRRSGPVPIEDAFYVYRRHGLPCRICGTDVRTAPLVGRNLYWCPNCQAPGN